MNHQDIIRRPIVTEKSTIAREQGNVVTFAVDPRSSKDEIAHAVEALFQVNVLEVRTMRTHRKTRRVGKNIGRRPAWKKALVTLAEGQTIEFFEGV